MRLIGGLRAKAGLMSMAADATALPKEDSAGRQLIQLPLTIAVMQILGKTEYWDEKSHGLRIEPKDIEAL